MIDLCQMLWDSSATKVGGVQFDLQGHDIRFTLGDLGTVQNTPAEVTQTGGDAGDPRPCDDDGGRTITASPMASNVGNNHSTHPAILGHVHGHPKLGHLWECLTAGCKAFSLAKGKGMGTKIG